MSKKTLEDQRASPPGLDSTLLMDWLAQQTSSGKEKKKKKQDTMTTPGTLNHTGISLG